MNHQQQINLFKEEFAFQINLFPGKTFIYSILILIGAVFLILIWSYSKLYYYKTQINNINRYEIEANNRIKIVKSSFMNKEVDKNHMVELKKLEDILYSKNVIQDKLKSFLSNNFSFSPILTALSRQHLKGLQLTEIRLTENIHTFLLQGVSTNPNLVTNYVERLQREDSFKGIKFDDFILGSSKDSKNELFVFRIGNTNLSMRNDK